MYRPSWLSLIPSIVLALAILMSTGIAVATANSGWWVLAGPLVMAFALVGTSLLGHRQAEGTPGNTRVALILGAALMLASVLVALRDPADVAALLPVLGACIAAPLGMRMDRGYTVSRCVG